VTPFTARLSTEIIVGTTSVVSKKIEAAPRKRGLAIGLTQDQQFSALCVGGGCRQPCRRHHGALTKARDGADCVARRLAHSKGFAAILHTPGDDGDDDRPQV
jgi:hypothetical protein